MDKENSFGKKLKQIRKAKGLTQFELAELADVHEKHISKLEIGCYKPSFETLNKILKALNVSQEEIGLDLKSSGVKNNPLYIKSIDILNSADEKELEIYYALLQQGRKCINLSKK